MTVTVVVAVASVLVLAVLVVAVVAAAVVLGLPLVAPVRVQGDAAERRRQRLPPQVRRALREQQRAGR